MMFTSTYSNTNELIPIEKLNLEMLDEIQQYIELSECSEEIIKQFKTTHKHITTFNKFIYSVYPDYYARAMCIYGVSNIGVVYLLKRESIEILESFKTEVVKNRIARYNTDGGGVSPLGSHSTPEEYADKELTNEIARIVGFYSRITHKELLSAVSNLKQTYSPYHIRKNFSDSISAFSKHPIIGLSCVGPNSVKVNCDYFSTNHQRIKETEAEVVYKLTKFITKGKET